MKIVFSTRSFKILTINFEPKCLLVCFNHREEIKVHFSQIENRVTTTFLVSLTI